MVIAAAAGLWFVDPDFLGRDQPPAGSDAPPPISGTVAEFTPSQALRPAPIAEFQDGNGRPVSIHDFGDRLVLLNIWATWCGPCVAEMPALDRLQAKLADEGLVVVAVSIDRQGVDIVKPFFQRLGIAHLPIYVDPQSRFVGEIGPRGLPTTLLIRNGLILGFMVGAAEWDAPEAVALVRHYLAGAKP